MYPIAILWVIVKHPLGEPARPHRYANFSQTDPEISCKTYQPSSRSTMSKPEASRNLRWSNDLGPNQKRERVAILPASRHDGPAGVKCHHHLYWRTLSWCPYKMASRFQPLSLLHTLTKRLIGLQIEDVLWKIFSRRWVADASANFFKVPLINYWALRSHYSNARNQQYAQAFSKQWKVFDLLK